MQKQINPWGFTEFVPNKVTEKIDSDKFIISREMKDDYVPTNDGVLKTIKVVETGRVLRDEYIQSFAEDVGLENILRQVAMTGDVSLLNKTQRDAAEIDYVDENGKSFEKIQDISNVPQGYDAANAFVEQSKALYKSLPEDMKGNMSFNEFVEKFTDGELKTYLTNVLAKQTKKEDAE